MTARPDDPFMQFVGLIAAGGGLAGAGAAVRHWGPRLWDMVRQRPASEAAVKKVEAEADLIKAQAINEVVKGAKDILGLQAAEIADLRTAFDRVSAEAREARADAAAARAESALLRDECARLTGDHQACETRLTHQQAEIDALRARINADDPVPAYEPKAAPRPRRKRT